MYVCVCVREWWCCKNIYIYGSVQKDKKKSCLMFEFCLRNQKKKKQRILFSGFGFVSLFTILFCTHTHTYTHTHTRVHILLLLTLPH